MKSKLIALLMVLAFGLMLLAVGCESLKTRTQKIAAGCASAAASTRVLTELLEAGKLTETQKYTVSKALDIISPICTADNPPTLNDADTILFAQSILTLEQEAIRHD